MCLMCLTPFCVSVSALVLLKVHDDIGNVSSLQHFTPSVLGEAKVQTFPVVLKQNMKMKAMK